MMIQDTLKRELKFYNSYVDHYFQFYHLMSHIQQSTCQLAADQFRIEFSHKILDKSNQV